MLTETSFNDIARSKSLFVRKMERGVSDKLMDMLDADAGTDNAD